DPAEDVRAVALHELSRLRQALVRLVTARALGQDLDAPPAGTLTGLAPEEQRAVAHVDPELREGPGIRVDDADPHGFALLALDAETNERECQCECRPAKQPVSHRRLSCQGGGIGMSLPRVWTKIVELAIC